MEKIIHYLKKPLGAFSKLPSGREHLVENFDHKNERHLYLAVLFSLFCVTAVSSIVVFMFRYEPSNAQKAQPQASVKPQTETEFLSNEILVKVKKTVKSKIKAGNSLDTGAVSLNKLNKDIGATKFEKFIKPGKSSKADADVFAWYKVTIGDGQEILSDGDTRPSIMWLKYLQTGIASKDPKELKKQKLKGSMARLLTDPNVEAVEFNFIVHTDQVPSCTLSVNSVTAGGTVTVTSVSSLFGSIGMQGSYGTPVYSNLGNLIANGSTPIVVPLDAQGGLYTVRVGGFGVGCTPNLTVIAAPTPTSTPTPTPTPTPIPTPTPTPPPLQLCPISGPNIPNDPYSCTSGAWGQAFPDLWGMKKINAENAWKQSTGSAQIIVASVDTGVDRNHEDLAANMWVNSNEIADNGIDDDADGYVDDYYGWDFANGDNDPIDDQGHGTHTSGTIGAVGNNGLGVVGVNWNVKIMALKFLSKSGSGSSENGANAIIYAADHGARVINNSWGGQGSSKIIHDAVEYAHSKNVVVVASAGNDNADASGFSPASEPNAITVAATDSSDVKATFSNWGTKIDVTAPGVDVLSLRAAGTDMYLSSAGYTACGKCVPTGDSNAKYYRANGTSMSGPHVSGLAALILANHPAFSPDEVRQVLRTSADDIDSPGFDLNTGRGRINAEKALNVPSTLNVAITSPSEGSPFGSSNSLDISGTAAGAGFVNYDVSYAQGNNLASWTNIASSSSPVTNGILATWQNLDSVPKGFYVIRVLARDSTGNTFDSYRTVVKEPGVKPVTSVDLPNAQFLPKVSGDKVIWWDWRNAPRTGMIPFDIYMYDFSKKTERRVTPASAFYFESDISGSNVVYTKSADLGDSDVYVFNLDTNVERQLTFSPDVYLDVRIYGNRVVYEQYSTSSIKLYDLSTNTERKLSDINPNGYVNRYVDIYGDKVAINDSINFRVLNLSTGAQTSISGSVNSFAIYGNYVAYANGSVGLGYDVYLYDLVNKTDKSVLHTAIPPLPDVFGNLIVWQGQDSFSYSGDRNIFSHNISNGQTQQITYSPATQYFPVTDGNRIFWADERGKDSLNTKIYMYDPPTTTPILTDSDKDGFTDDKELFMGTDQDRVCGLNTWPPDIDGDGAVSVLDLAKIAQAYGSKAGDAKYNKRYDLDADGKISILDLSIAGQYFTSKCANPVKTK